MAVGSNPSSEADRAPGADAGVATAPGAEEDPVAVDRILTLPNAITLVRLLCIPIFLYLLFVRDARLGAAVLLGALGATDWVDGYAARHLGQVSNFGKAFDPTVDRLLLITGVISIIVAEGQSVMRPPAAGVTVRSITRVAPAPHGMLHPSFSTHGPVWHDASHSFAAWHGRLSRSGGHSLPPLRAAF